MNHISIDGKLTCDAQMELQCTPDGRETPMLVFGLMDTGAPFAKKSPTFIEVNFKKEAATTIFPYMTKGKSVIVYGSLSMKGKNQRYYIAADAIKFIDKESVEAAS